MHKIALIEADNTAEPSTHNHHQSNCERQRYEPNLANPDTKKTIIDREIITIIIINKTLIEADITAEPNTKQPPPIQLKERDKEKNLIA